jgi:GntR family transcriptional regulator
MKSDLRGLGYKAIAVVLREWVDCGRYRAGDRFPTEAALVRMFGVSRVTLRRALGELARDGVIESKQGTGTFVSPAYAPHKLAWKLPESGGERTYAGLTDWIDADTHRYLGRAEVRRSEEERLSFGPRAGPMFTSLTYLRVVGGEPVALLVLDLVDWAADLIAGASDAVLLHVNAYLRERGVTTRRARMTLNAATADRHLARQLEVPVHAPLVRMTYLCFDQRDRPYQKMDYFFRADRFRHELEFHLRPAARADESGSGAPRRAAARPRRRSARAVVKPARRQSNRGGAS